MKNLQLLRQTEKPAFSHHGKTPNTFVSLVAKGRNQLSIGDISEIVMLILREIGFLHK
jgi:hypothetical protein